MGTVSCMTCGFVVDEAVSRCPNCGLDPKKAGTLSAERNAVAGGPRVGGLVTGCVLGALSLAAFLIIRWLATPPSLTSMLEGGRTWYLKPQVALPVEVSMLALFGAFFALAIWSIVTMARFAPQSAAPPAAGSASEPVAAQRLRDLASLRDQGLISAQEYEAKRAEVLSRMIESPELGSAPLYQGPATTAAQEVPGVVAEPVPEVTQARQPDDLVDQTTAQRTPAPSPQELQADLPASPNRGRGTLIVAGLLGGLVLVGVLVGTSMRDQRASTPTSGGARPAASSQPSASGLTPSGASGPVPATQQAKMDVLLSPYAYVPASLPDDFVYTDWKHTNLVPTLAGRLLTIEFAAPDVGRIIWTSSRACDPKGRIGPNATGYPGYGYGMVADRSAVVAGRRVYFSPGNHGSNAWTCFPLETAGGTDCVAVGIWESNCLTPSQAMELVAHAVASGGSNEVTVTLPVRVLRTTSGASSHERLRYPASVTIQVPSQWAHSLEACGIAGRVFVAPKGWTAGAVGQIDADGGRFVNLASGRSDIPGDMTYSLEVSHFAVWQDASVYIPWVRRNWSLSGIGGSPPPLGPPGIDPHTFPHFAEHEVNPYRVEYEFQNVTSSLWSVGLASTTLRPGHVSAPASYEQLQYELPRRDRALGRYMVNWFTPQLSQ